MDQIPIKYLVTQAQGLQQELGGETLESAFYFRIMVCGIKYLAAHQLQTDIAAITHTLHTTVNSTRQLSGLCLSTLQLQCFVKTLLSGSIFETNEMLFIF